MHGIPDIDFPGASRYVCRSGDQELWLSELNLRSTVTARSEKRNTARKGHVTRGVFFWFGFFFAKENDQKRPISLNIFIQF